MPHLCDYCDRPATRCFQNAPFDRVNTCDLHAAIHSRDPKIASLAVNAILDMRDVERLSQLSRTKIRNIFKDIDYAAEEIFA